MEYIIAFLILFVLFYLFLALCILFLFDKH